MQASQRSKERRAYFEAGVAIFASHNFVAGMAAGAAVGIFSVVLDLSSGASVFAMTGAWLASNAAVSFWLSVTADRADELQVQLDRF